jgi:hypothetical protein
MPDGSWMLVVISVDMGLQQPCHYTDYTTSVPDYRQEVNENNLREK